MDGGGMDCHNQLKAPTKLRICAKDGPITQRQRHTNASAIKAQARGYNSLERARGGRRMFSIAAIGPR
jgi:hypothetical protein